MRCIHIFILLAITTAGLAQRTKLVTPNEGASIKIITHKINDGSDVVVNTSPFFGFSYGSAGHATVGEVDTTFVGIDSGFYKSNTEEILVLLEKEGYKTKTQLITLDQVRANKKRVVLKKIEKLPLRKNDDAYIVIKQVEFKVRRKNYIQKFYDTYKDLEKRSPERISYSEDDVLIENTVFEDRLNALLVKTHHIDTTQKLNLNIFDRIKVKITVTGLTEHKFGAYCLTELRSTVSFESFFGNKREVEKEYITLGNIGYEYASNNKNLIGSALENVFIQMLEDPEVSRNFKNPEKELKKLNDSLAEIIISNKSTEAPNLENATNAVVTVIVPQGHGSGCVISNDGYIITNYHVVGGDTNDVYAIFNSGAKKRCVFVRGNPVYDLALLKVDTAIAVPLKVNLSKTISVGADVYAIGTPKNINLGQSITKGIISAKRNIENKIYIQSDVSVNSGNSGGAMTNKEGELIGIVNAKLVGYGIEGVSFAIPAFYIEEFLRIKFLK